MKPQWMLIGRGKSTLRIPSAEWPRYEQHGWILVAREYDEQPASRKDYGEQ